MWLNFLFPFVLSLLGCEIIILEQFRREDIIITSKLCDYVEKQVNAPITKLLFPPCDLLDSHSRKMDNGRDHEYFLKLSIWKCFQRRGNKLYGLFFKNWYHCFVSVHFITMHWKKYIAREVPSSPAFHILLFKIIFLCNFWLQLLMFSYGGTRKSLQVRLVVPQHCGFSLSCLDTT